MSSKSTVNRQINDAQRRLGGTVSAWASGLRRVAEDGTSVVFTRQSGDVINIDTIEEVRLQLDTS